MKLLVFADLQATNGHERCRSQPNVSLQQWRVTKFFTDALAIYNEHECDGVIDLGDTTDDRSSIPVPTLDALMAGIEQFPDSPWNIKIVGNHEQYIRDGRVNTGRLFRHKFNVVDTMKVFKYDTRRLVFASFGTELEITDYLMKTADRYQDNALVLFGHFQVQGCLMNSGIAPNGVPLAALKQFQLGLLGHVHKPQDVTDRIHYVGSPFQQNYGEAGESKRVGILDLDQLTLTWVKLEGYPRYRVIEWSEWESVDFTSEDRVKVILRNQEDVAAFYAHQHCALADEAIYDFERAPDSGVSAKVESSGWSAGSVLERYTRLNPPPFDISPEELIKTGEIVGDIH